MRSVEAYHAAAPAHGNGRSKRHKSKLICADVGTNNLDVCRHRDLDCDSRFSSHRNEISCIWWSPVTRAAIAIPPRTDRLIDGGTFAGRPSGCPTGAAANGMGAARASPGG